MSDLVERQAAIDALNECRERTERSEEFAGLKIAVGVMRALPSAQPEIIRCKDCFCGHGEVWLSGNGEVDAYGYCGRTNLRVLPYDYCSWAERKTNGSD